MSFDEVEQPEDGNACHSHEQHQGRTPLATEQSLGLHCTAEVHSGVRRQLREAVINFGRHHRQLNHLGDGHYMDEHCWINVDGNWIEDVRVEVVRADKATESNAREFGQVHDSDRDGEGKWEDPAEPCQPAVVAVNDVAMPNSEQM